MSDAFPRPVPDRRLRARPPFTLFAHLAVAVLLLGGPAGADPPARADLQAAIADYLKSPTDRAATEALKQFDRAPIAEVRECLRGLVAYPPAKGHETFVVERGKLKLTCHVVPPAAYDPARAYPLIFSMWGVSTNGKEGVQAWSSATDVFVAAIDLPADSKERPGYPDHQTGIKGFNLALPELLRRYHVDPDRVFLTGFSMGGVFTWYVAGSNPDTLAGAVPVAGISLRDLPGLDPRAPSPLRSVFNCPLYIVQGVKDPTEAKVDLMRGAVHDLETWGFRHVYREFADMGHSWPPADELAKIRDWMKAQRRDPRPAHLIAVTNSYMNPGGRVFWLQLRGGKPGFLDFDGRIFPENKIDIETAAITRLELLLDDGLADPGKDLAVTVNGKEVFHGRVVPSLRTALDAYLLTRDPERTYTITLPVQVP